jgi:hypothetical protein
VVYNNNQCSYTVENAPNISTGVIEDGSGMNQMLFGKKKNRSGCLLNSVSESK